MKIKIIGLVLVSSLFLISCDDEEVVEEKKVKITTSEPMNSVDCETFDSQKNDQSLIPFYTVLWGQKTGSEQHDKFNNNIERMDEALKTLYGEKTWLRVYVQHNRNYTELCKRVNVVLCGEVNGQCLTK